MGQVIWSPSSLEDIEQVAQFISRDSSDQAALFVGRLIEATDRLASVPLSGRVIPEIGLPDCREIIYGAYRIMYRLECGDVWITGVVHGARDWNPGAR
jgi:toxin ParE1/3/4